MECASSFRSKHGVQLDLAPPISTARHEIFGDVAGRRCAAACFLLSPRFLPLRGGRASGSGPGVDRRGAARIRRHASAARAALSGEPADSAAAVGARLPPFAAAGHVGKLVALAPALAAEPAQLPVVVACTNCARSLAIRAAMRLRRCLFLLPLSCSDERSCSRLAIFAWSSAACTAGCIVADRGRGGAAHVCRHPWCGASTHHGCVRTI